MTTNCMYEIKNIQLWKNTVIWIRSYKQVTKNEVKKNCCHPKKLTVTEVILNECVCQLVKKSSFWPFIEWNVSVAVTCLSGPIDAWLASLNSSPKNSDNCLFICVRLKNNNLSCVEKTRSKMRFESKIIVKEFDLFHFFPSPSNPNRNWKTMKGLLTNWYLIANPLFLWQKAKEKMFQVKKYQFNLNKISVIFW